MGMKQLPVISTSGYSAHNSGFPAGLWGISDTPAAVSAPNSAKICERNPPCPRGAEPELLVTAVLALAEDTVSRDQPAKVSPTGAKQ